MIGRFIGRTALLTILIAPYSAPAGVVTEVSARRAVESAAKHSDRSDAQPTVTLAAERGSGRWTTLRAGHDELDGLDEIVMQVDITAPGLRRHQAALDWRASAAVIQSPAVVAVVSAYARRELVPAPLMPLQLSDLGAQ